MGTTAWCFVLLRCLGGSVPDVNLESKLFLSICRALSNWRWLACVWALPSVCPTNCTRDKSSWQCDKSLRFHAITFRTSSNDHTLNKWWAIVSYIRSIWEAVGNRECVLGTDTEVRVCCWTFVPVVLNEIFGSSGASESCNELGDWYGDSCGDWSALESS